MTEQQMEIPAFFFVFDVESVGLHGEGFAVGWTVIDTAKRIAVAEGLVSCPLDAAVGALSDRDWVKEHVVPALSALRADSGELVGLATATFATPAEVRALFWEHWASWRKAGAVMAADCLWPVEARFLSACVDTDPEARRWKGPYPFVDIGSVLLGVGKNPLGHFGRTLYERPEHNPLCDARQSARLLLEALGLVPEAYDTGAVEAGA